MKLLNMSITAGWLILAVLCIRLIFSFSVESQFSILPSTETFCYFTPGIPVKMDVEKGAWFKIGVNIQNPTDESKDVYVSVSNVVVRIASSVGDNESDRKFEQVSDDETAAPEENHEKGISSQAKETPTESDSLQEGMMEFFIEAPKLDVWN